MIILDQLLKHHLKKQVKCPKAAKHGELDELTGISSNIMCGQIGNYGTSAFNVYLNINEYYHKTILTMIVKKMKVKILFQNTNELSGEASDNFCSINNIQMDSNFDKQIIHLPVL